MDTNKTLMPHILCAMSSAPNQQQSLDRIVRFVEAKLGDKAKQISNIKEKIKMALTDASAFGLVSMNRNMARLRYHAKAKSLVGFQPTDESEDRDDEMDDDEDPQNTASTSTATKPKERAKSSKNSNKKSSEYSLLGPAPTEIRRRKKKSRGRSRRGRSKSPKRRRKH